MKHWVAVWLLAPVLACAEIERFNRALIQTYPLSPDAIYHVPIGNTPTTITFPGALTSLDGANVATDLDTPAAVLLSYQPGLPFFTLRATQPEAQAALNVVYRGQTYVFNLFHHEETLPYRSVRLTAEASLLPSSREVKSPNAATPGHWLELLDRAKAYPLLALHHSDWKDEVERFAPDALVTPYADFIAQVEEVYRFVEAEALVLRVTLASLSDGAIFYTPQTLSVRVGPNLYYPALVDASGILPPQSLSTVYLVLAGDAAGLSVRNRFLIVVNRLASTSETAAP